MLTQKQLAEQLGVSQQAVSFALNGGGTLKQSTRDFITKEAQKAGYRVNAASRLFREGRTNSIALIVQGKYHVLPNLMLSAIRPLLREKEMHLTLFGAEPEDFADPNNPPRLVRELSADGFLVMDDGVLSEELNQHIAHYRIPSVWINHVAKHYSVYPDEEGISARLVREIAKHLKGHYLYIGNSEEGATHFSAPDRRKGFERGLQECGLTGEVLQIKHHQEQRHDDIANILSRKSKRPRVIITYAVEDAQTIYLQAARLGIRIPQDVFVCSYSRIRAQIAHMEIPRVLVPVHLCGVVGLEMLLKRIENPDKKIKSVAVDDFIFNEFGQLAAV